MKNQQIFYNAPFLPFTVESLATALVTKIFEFHVSVKTYRDFIKNLSTLNLKCGNVETARLSLEIHFIDHTADII